MRRVVTFTFALSILSGCATVDPTYYTKPDSPGYHEQVFSGLCELCGKKFVFSAEQWETLSAITCPYDGREQDLRLAHTRYNETVQQAQAQLNAAFAAQAAQIIIQGQTRTAQRQASYVQCMNACRAQQRMLGYQSLSTPVECMNVCLNQ